MHTILQRECKEANGKLCELSKKSAQLLCLEQIKQMTSGILHEIDNKKRFFEYIYFWK